MEVMRSLRTFGPSFRTAMAVLFGIMSLAHGPVMAFAQPQTPAAHHQPVAHHAAHHAGHDSMATEQRNHHRPATTSTCYAIGCFVAVAPVSVDAPDNISSLRERLEPALADAIVSADIEPSVPPPRPQA